MSRIDVHHHLTPPRYAEQLAPGGKLTPFTLSWTPAKAIEQMEQGAVDRSITSITTPGLWFGDNDRARALARACNDYAAELMGKYPGRFGMFVNLPLPDVEGSLREIEYGLDVLKADGVAVFTSYADKWIGDPAFDAVFDELNRRKALLYTHPTTCSCCTDLVPGINDSIIEYQTDTSRAIARYVFSGTAARCPDVDVIWSHGGGTLPFLLDRFINAARIPPYRDRFPQGFLQIAQRFFYDIAQVPNKPALSALKAFLPVSQLLFGTDFPFPLGNAAHHAKGLRESGVFSEAELLAIDADNARRLFNAHGSAWASTQ